MSEPAATQAVEIPGEPGVYWCARHRKVRTRLRCGRCERPICPRCTVYGPTGARCRDCASNRSAHIYQVGAAQLLFAFGVALGLGLVGALLVRLPLGLLVLLYAPVVGTLIGKVVSRVTHGKRGIKVAVAASAGVIVGSLVPLDPGLLLMWMNGGGAPATANPLLYMNYLNPLLWLYMVFAVTGLWWWLK